MAVDIRSAIRAGWEESRPLLYLNFNEGMLHSQWYHSIKVSKYQPPPLTLAAEKEILWANDNINGRC